MFKITKGILRSVNITREIQDMSFVIPFQKITLSIMQSVTTQHFKNSLNHSVKENISNSFSSARKSQNQIC